MKNLPADSFKKILLNDQRGSLHSLKNFSFPIKEILISQSHAGVLRGLHWSPYRKQIYVTRGKIYDFWYVPDTMQVFEGVLTLGETLVIPANAMHGFYAIEETSMLYFLENNFDPSVDHGYYWASPGLPFKYEFPRENLIISPKDQDLPFYNTSDYLLLGSSGYLGAYMEKTLKEQSKRYITTAARLSDSKMLEFYIKKSRCKYVICAAGISGRPTTAWCETNEKETYQVNYLQMLELMNICDGYGVHLTIFGTGMLYKFNSEKSCYSEKDQPDLDSSVYVRYRVALESHLHLYPNVLCLRIIYPITADDHPKCFLTKMKSRLNTVDNVSVPITVVPELFPEITKLIETGVNGPLNFVANGTISLPKLLELFKLKDNNESTVPKPGVELSTDYLSRVCGRSIPSVEDALKLTIKD